MQKEKEAKWRYDPSKTFRRALGTWVSVQGYPLLWPWYYGFVVPALICAHATTLLYSRAPIGALEEDL